MDLPESDTQAPNSFHLVTRSPACTDPVAVYDMSSIVLERLLELIVELCRGFGNTVRSNDLAVQVGEWSANNNGNDAKSDEHHAVHPSIDEIRKDIIDV